MRPNRFSKEPWAAELGSLSTTLALLVPARNKAQGCLPLCPLARLTQILHPPCPKSGAPLGWLVAAVLAGAEHVLPACHCVRVPPDAHPPATQKSRRGRPLGKGGEAQGF